ncbi:MAG TPA: FAD-binding protein, partial [Microlunatus sp.]|nr:FAD-binding protein [Microlunatus sp.]
MTESLTLIEPAAEEYDAARTGFQTYRPLRPDLIAVPETVDDLAAAVRIGAGRGLPIAVQATGHGTPDGPETGLLITTSRLTGVRIDPERRTALVDAGADWGTVVAAAAGHGLAGLAGNARTVGAVGYTVGGGLGPLGRRYGFAADHVRSVELITAAGEPLTVTADSDPDLFWAVRGGGGNFGVVARIELDLFPVDRLYGGMLIFDTPLLERGMRTWREWLETVPDQVTSTAVVVPFPDLPQLPPPLRGRHVLSVRVTVSEDVERGEELVRPLREIGEPLVDTLRVLPYAEIATINNDPTEPAASRTAGALLDDLDPAVITELLAAAGPGTERPPVIELRHLGGAVARPPAVPNAIDHRDAGFLLGLVSPLPVP